MPSPQPADDEPRGRERDFDDDSPTDKPNPATAASFNSQGADLTEFTALEQRGRSGANWFFWVAALSIVNSAILLSGENRHFVIGLAVTQMVDGIGQKAPEAATVAKTIAFSLSVFISAIVAVFGWLSRRRILPVYVLGMVLYLLDGLVFVLFSDWMSAGFHAFALWGMWNGLTAFRELKAREDFLPTGAAHGTALEEPEPA